MKKGTKEKVTLGSGKLYMAEFTGDFAKDFAEILKQLMTEEITRDGSRAAQVLSTSPP